MKCGKGGWDGCLRLLGWLGELPSVVAAVAGGAGMGGERGWSGRLQCAVWLEQLLWVCHA